MWEITFNSPIMRRDGNSFWHAITQLFYPWLHICHLRKRQIMQKQKNNETSKKGTKGGLKMLETSQAHMYISQTVTKYSDR